MSPQESIYKFKLSMVRALSAEAIWLFKSGKRTGAFRCLAMVEKIDLTSELTEKDRELENILNKNLANNPDLIDKIHWRVYLEAGIPTTEIDQKNPNIYIIKP